MYPDLSIYTLQPDEQITKDMDHDTVLATDVVRLLVDSQVSDERALCQFHVLCEISRCP